MLNLIGFHWVAHTVSQFGQLPVAVGFLVLLLFCSLAHLYFPVSGLLWFLLKKRFKLSPLYAVVLLPLTFLLLEWSFPTIFFWHLGYTWLWARLPGYQLADWIGFYGLNTFTLAVNAGLFYAYLYKSSRLKLLGSIALCFVLLGGLHFLRPRPFGSPQDDKALSVTVIQGNIGNLAKIQGGKGFGQAISAAVKTFLDLSRQALEEHPDTDLLVWPETAFPETIVNQKPRRYQVRKVFSFLKDSQVDLITGAYQTFSKNPGQPYNSMVLLDQDGNFHPGYQKTYLLAFGEYFPGAKIFPQLKKWFPMVSDFGRGQGAQPFPYKDIMIGGQICYEGLFDRFSTDLQTQGAQIFINVTNDSWFWYPFEPYQHMYMTLARAIENRRPLIRATNTGISTMIDSQGLIKELSDHGQPWFGNYKVHYSRSPVFTPYRRLAPLWPYLFLAFIVLTVVLGSRARKN